MITFLFLAISLALLSWYFWSTIILCSKLPNYFLVDWRVMRKIFLGHGSHKLPLRTIIFQRWVNTCEKHRTEDMLLVWSVKPMLIVHGPKAVKFLMTEASLTDKADLYKILEIITGNGILTCNGEENKRQRKEIQPAFYVSALKDMVPLFNEHAESFVQILSKLESKPTLAMQKILKDQTLKIFFDAALEIKANSGDVRMDCINNLHSKLFENISKRVLTPWLNFDFISQNSKIGKELDETKDEVFSAIKQVFEEIKKKVTCRMENMKSSEVMPSSKSSRKSFAQVLIEQVSNDSSLDMHYCITQLVTLIEGGTHTTSITLKWALWLLGLYQDVQERAYEEIISITHGKVDYDDARSLIYLECIIKETLRLYPPVPMFGRKSKKDIHFGDYTIPKNMCIYFFAYSLHHNSEIYSDPEAFNPDRFAEGESDIKPWMYIPFAEGTRSCIGKNFGMLEMKIILAHILRNFKVITLGKREDILLSFQIFLNSVNEPSMQFIPR